MKQFTPLKPRPAPLPEGGFTSGVQQSKNEIDIQTKMQASLAKITDWLKKLKRRSAMPRIRENDVQIDAPGSEHTADRHRESNEGTHRTQTSVGHGAFLEICQDNRESITFTPKETDLTGFMEFMIKQAKEAGVFALMDGFCDEAKTVASEDPDRSKDEHQLDDTDNLTGTIPEKVNCSTQNDHESPRDTASSKTTPTSTPPESLPNEDPYFDDLCNFMEEAAIQTSNQKSAMRFEIPKAYKFSISTEPKCHYDSVAFFKAGTECHLQTGKKRNRENLGFKPHEVIKKGALYVAGLDVKCSLTGDVHPVFDERHWTDCPHHIYKTIKPALLLASKFLNTPQCLQHFQTVLRGNREYCFDTSFRKKQNCYRIRNDVPLTQESAEDIIRHIETMAGSITFQFLDAANSPAFANKYFATARMVPCHHNSSSVTSSPQKTVISLHTDFYIQAQKLRRLRYPDLAQVLRFQFFLATNLMHEFAHAFEIACSPDETRKGMEVYMYDWLEAESGKAWEAAIFGGRVTVINARCDGLHGLCVVEWPEPGLRNRARAGQSDIWSVSMEFVNDLFQQSYWEEIGKKNVGETGLSFVPRIGATSVGISSFTTVSFEEVLEERDMGCLELALREVERDFQCPKIVKNNAEVDERERGGKRRKTMQKKMHIPADWRKKAGRRGGFVLMF